MIPAFFVSITPATQYQWRGARSLQKKHSAFAQISLSKDLRTKKRHKLSMAGLEVFAKDQECYSEHSGGVKPFWNP